jgi:hypothetical protein
MLPLSLSSSEIDALLRLLDDDTPAVRERVVARLAACGGDLSGWFAAHPRELGTAETELLAGILRPAKRATVAKLWKTGASRLAKTEAPGWPEVEPMLALLADLLHDGITPRPALGELLDNLAQSAREGGVTDEMSLRDHLFNGLRFTGNEDGYHDPRNSDLAWSIESRRSNPIGLCLIYILVGHRLGYQIEGVGYPGHFLCRIHPQGVPVLVDCFGNGQVHLQATLLEPESDLTRQQRAELRKTATPVGTLVRVLNNLAAAFQAAERQEDFQLVQRLRAMIED